MIRIDYPQRKVSVRTITGSGEGKWYRVRMSRLRPVWPGLLVGLLALASCTKPPGGGETPAQTAPLASAASTAGAATAAPVTPAAATPKAAEPAPADEYQGVATGSNGAVSSAEANASDVGVRVLEKGGNAVDAAVAVAFALGVTHPSAGNIGGGGFMVVRTPDGKTTAIDYREVAPGRASRDMYLDAQGKPTDQSRVGPLAAGIPGVVRGLEYAHKKYGRLPWAELVAPAIALAREGWKLDTNHASDLASVSERMAQYADQLAPEQTALKAAMSATLATFRKPDGGNYARGDQWQQPDLAVTLDAIAKSGADAFYRGALAKKLATSVAEMGGIWTEKDLQTYKVIEREPIRFSYHGHDIVSMPPPSAGGITLRQILAASDVLHLEKLPWDSVERIHLYVESLRRNFADRNELLGDPGFIDIPIKKMLDTSYMAKRMADIDPNKATPSSQIGSGVPSQEKPHTTHFSVVDKDRMAVSNTFTLNGDFGAKVQVPGTGVTLNNEMDDFTSKVGAPNMFGLVQGPQNGIQPGKRMLSSMSPTIIVKDGKLRAVVGSPGGPTIITTVAQIVLQVIDHQRSLEQAVDAVRIHHQWLPDQILHEAGLPPDTIAALTAMGHTLKERPRIGHANCIEVDPKTGALIAVADVKRDGGKASAY
jgi:gamma-glutamyltranspeptidase / glutathione hydrolase